MRANGEKSRRRFGDAQAKLAKTKRILSRKFHQLKAELMTETRFCLKRTFM